MPCRQSGQKTQHQNRQAMMTEWAAARSIGDREEQEDDFGVFSCPDETILVLADGMGGEAAGSIASNRAVDAFLKRHGSTKAPTPNRLLASLDEANGAISAEIENDFLLEGMGTTLVAAHIADGGVEWISVGDSPMWLFRFGQLERLNEDHSINGSNVLRSAVSGAPIEMIDQSSRALQHDDWLLLASDGLLTLEPEQITATLEAYTSYGPQITVDALIEAVDLAAKPGQDNTTVIVCRIGLDNQAGEHG